MRKQVYPDTYARDGKTIDLSNGQLIRWDDTWCLKEKVSLIIASLAGSWVLCTDHVLETKLTVFLSSAFSEQFFSHLLSGIWSHVCCAVDMALLLDHWIQD